MSKTDPGRADWRPAPSSVSYRARREKSAVVKDSSWWGLWLVVGVVVPTFSSLSSSVWEPFVETIIAV